MNEAQQRMNFLLPASIGSAAEKRFVVYGGGANRAVTYGENNVIHLETKRWPAGLKARRQLELDRANGDSQVTNLNTPTYDHNVGVVARGEVAPPARDAVAPAGRPVVEARAGELSLLGEPVSALLQLPGDELGRLCDALERALGLDAPARAGARA